MKAFAKKPATYEDLVALPESMVGEMVEGELWASPRPAMLHAQAAGALHGQLWGSLGGGRGGPGGWWILFEPELHLGGSVLVPDLAGWRRERLPTIPNAPFLTLAPDWVCEVLSKPTARLDRVVKMPKYAKIGVPHAWLVDPAMQTLEVFRRQDEGWFLAGSHVGDEKVRAEPFDAMEVELGMLWVPDQEQESGTQG